MAVTDNGCNRDRKLHKMAVWQLSTLLLIVSHLLFRGGRVDSDDATARDAAARDAAAKDGAARLPRFVKGCFDKVMVHNQ